MADVVWRCPLPDHDDAYASCQVYAEVAQGWVLRVHGGGRIYDLASLPAAGPWGGVSEPITRRLVPEQIANPVDQEHKRRDHDEHRDPIPPLIRVPRRDHQ